MLFVSLLFAANLKPETVGNFDDVLRVMPARSGKRYIIVTDHPAKYSMQYFQEKGIRRDPDIVSDINKVKIQAGQESILVIDMIGAFPGVPQHLEGGSKFFIRSAKIHAGNCPLNLPQTLMSKATDRRAWRTFADGEGLDKPRKEILVLGQKIDGIPIGTPFLIMDSKPKGGNCLPYNLRAQDSEIAEIPKRYQDVDFVKIQEIANSIRRTIHVFHSNESVYLASGKEMTHAALGVEVSWPQEPIQNDTLYLLKSFVPKADAEGPPMFIYLFNPTGKGIHYEYLRANCT